VARGWLDGPKDGDANTYEIQPVLRRHQPARIQGQGGVVKQVTGANRLQVQNVIWNSVMYDLSKQFGFDLADTLNRAVQTELSRQAAV